MEKEDIAYCGLDCALCQQRFDVIRSKIDALDEEFEKVNVQEIVKVIRSPKLKLHNQVDPKSRFFMKLNRVLPGRLRDLVLLRQMDIQ